MKNPDLTPKNEIDNIINPENENTKEISNRQLQLMTLFQTKSVRENHIPNMDLYCLPKILRELFITQKIYKLIFRIFVIALLP